MEHPRCPFATRGLDSVAMAGCPGFRATWVGFAMVGAGEDLPGGVSCEHLGAQDSPRGYISACGHPGGLPLQKVLQPAGACTVLAKRQTDALIRTEVAVA